MTAPVHGSDPHWLLGLAQERAHQILKLLQIYEVNTLRHPDGDSILEAIREEAQAILDQTDQAPAKDDAT